jgi:hypothetical protein
MNIQDTLSLSASGVTKWYSLREQTVATMVLTIPDGPVGTFALEGSNDVATVDRERNTGLAPEDSEADYADVTPLWYASTSLTATGSARAIALSVSVPTSYVRVRYTRTSGTGTLNLDIAATASTFVVGNPDMSDVGNSTVADYAGLLVSDFVPDNILTAANFETGFRAAIAAAYSTYDMDGYAGLSVVVPRGNWPLDLDNGNFVFPGTYGAYGINSQGRTPGLRGSGEAATFLMMSGNCPGQGAIEFGIDGEEQTYAAHIRDISVASVSGSTTGSGIRFRVESFNAHVQNVTVYGFGEVQEYNDGFGLAFDSPSSGQHQHVHINHLTVQACQVGVKLENCIQLNISQLHATQNYVASAILAGCQGGWFGGTVQDGVDPTTGRGLGWYRGTLFPSISTGWNELIASGTGATLSAATYATDTDTGIAGVGTCVVTGLADMEQLYEGMWLLLDNAETPGPGLKIKGLYQIVRVVSATSVVINKGTDHAITGSLSWELRAGQASHMVLDGFVWHEGDKRCTLFIGPNHEFGYEQWDVTGLQSFNTIPVLAVNGFSTELRLNSLYASGTPKARIKGVKTLFTDHVVAQDGLEIIIDDVTRRQMSEQNRIVRRSRTPNQLVTEMGGWSWSADREDTFTLSSGTNVDEWRSVQDADVVFEPQNASQFCIYDPADTGFDSAAVQIVGGATGGTYKALIATIPAAKLPESSYFATTVMVGRLLSTTPESGNRVITARVSSGATFNAVGVNDAVFFPTGIYSVPWASAAGAGNAPSQPSDLATATTDPFLIFSSADWDPNFAGGDAYADGRLKSFSPRTSSAVTRPLGAYYGAQGTDLVVRIPEDVGVTNNPFMVAWFAIIPYAVPEAEIDVLRALLTDRYPLPTV